MSPLLSLDDLHVSLASAPVLSGVTTRIGPGECVGLIGPNGAGKSTLLRAALGLLPARGGRALGGTALERLSPRDRARRASYVAQDREIGWPVTVERIVALGRNGHRRLGRALNDADWAAIESAMTRMDIARLRHRAATDLSGGERARVLIARALAQDTPLLLADEPTAGLDPAHQIALMTILSELARDGRGVMVSLHDLGLAARWCTRLVLLDEGRVVADGPPETVLTADALATVYGVTAHLDRDDGGMILQPITLMPARKQDPAPARQAAR